MKAFRYVLSRKGNYWSKVVILVGGPDWPTSVFTGILGLPMLPMLAGTLPVLVPIALTVLAGGGMLKAAGGDDLWVALPPPPRTKWTRRVPHPVLIGHAASLSQVALSGLFLSLAAASLSACAVGLMGAIERVLAANRAEILVLSRRLPRARLPTAMVRAASAPAPPPRKGPISRGGGTRRVRFVRGVGRGVSD